MSSEKRVDTTITETTPLLSSTEKEKCFNFHQLCNFWAEMEECQKNPFWMRPNCQKACKSCGESLDNLFLPDEKPSNFNCFQKYFLSLN